MTTWYIFGNFVYFSRLVCCARKNLATPIDGAGAWYGFPAFFSVSATDLVFWHLSEKMGPLSPSEEKVGVGEEKFFGF
jgi:hypothetical protein